MTPLCLFQSEGLAALTRQVAPDTLFAFDLDGTLAPIAADYSGARIEEPVRLALRQLARMARVCVITGRSRDDAQSILGFTPHLLIGNHGSEWPPDESNPRNWHFIKDCLKWRQQLHDMLFSEQGVEIEFKGESLSLHYRKAVDREQALARIEAAIEKLDPVPRIIRGKLVMNVVSAEASTKGEALVAAMDRLGSAKAVYFGDDKTDEEVFRLKEVAALGIRIGEEDETAANYFLHDQAEVLNALKLMIGMLERHVQEQYPERPLG